MIPASKPKPGTARPRGPISRTPRASSGRPRRAGVTIPLFSLRTARSWGIGEIGDLPAFAGWMATAGISLVQLLPLGEISGGDTSPYSAQTAFAIDPMYIAMADVPDLPAEDVGLALGHGGAIMLEAARASSTVDYGAVRSLKQRALRFAFQRFQEREEAARTPRAQALDAFIEAHAEWLPDYTLFRAIKDTEQAAAWTAWPGPLRAREPAALEEARRRLAPSIRYHAYTQWLARTQWDAARAALRGADVELMGDLPFMVGRDSADVWSHQDEFKTDASVGVPPDVFNTEGQDWDLPPYDWQAMRRNDFAWLRSRARATGALFDRFRIDHVVGFYRVYSRPSAQKLDKNGKLRAGSFDPATEAEQLPHGERVITAMIEGAAESHARLIGEDLGIVPDFVRPSLTKLGVPGYKVLIWEKDEQVFRDPREYPELSVACFGTHDTDPVAAWWETRDAAERAALEEILDEPGPLGATLTEAVHRALMDLLSGSGSELVLFLIQDLLGTRDRVNTPATVGAHNWSYRLPATIEELHEDPDVARLMAMARDSVRKGGRAVRG